MGSFIIKVNINLFLNEKIHIKTFIKMSINNSSFNQSYPFDWEFPTQKDLKFQTPETNNHGKTVNLTDIRETMYPRFLSNNLAYDYHSKKTVEYCENDNTLLYVSYLKRDDSYDSYVFESIRDLKEYAKYEGTHMYIFRMICKKGENLEYASLMQFCDYYNCQPYLDLISPDFFPTFLPISPGISKLDFEKYHKDNNKGSNQNCKISNIGDNYICITSGYLFTIEGDEGELDANDVNYIRIIVYKDNNQEKFKIDRNTYKASYPYDDYKVFFYAIPLCNTPIEIIEKLLLESFITNYLFAP